MPIYGFECLGCGHRFDQLQKLSDPDPSRCPQCDADGLRRQVSAPSFRLAGGGWYETDFKNDREKRRNLVESPESSSGGKAEGKPNAKPDAGTGPKTESGSESKGQPRSEPKSEPKSSSKPPPSPPAASTTGSG